MLITSKDVDRAELHGTIRKISDELRGHVDGWDFKNYVIGVLFYRFLSDKLTSYINTEETLNGNEYFDYELLSDEDAERWRHNTVSNKGFYILPSELFNAVLANARKHSNLSETLCRIFDSIECSAVGATSESVFKGIFGSVDLNSKKLGQSVGERNEKLLLMMDSIGRLPIADGGDFAKSTVDIFGDVYEYLIHVYSPKAGKSGGEFYTPPEVSELLARIASLGKTEVNSVYDPTCGSGSLLLKFAKVIGKNNIRKGIFGQEINPTSYNMCKINMVLHDVDLKKFNIAYGDTLSNPERWDGGRFDIIVSNPPYSTRWEGTDNRDFINDPRFSPAGVLAPKSKSDLAFVMHILSYLEEDGTAAIIEHPGVLFRLGAEQKIRKYLIDNNYVDSVIQLPHNLFFGTPIATCIIILKKARRDRSVLFIDASSEFIRTGCKNKLTDDNQQRIIDAYSERKDTEYFSSVVDTEKIAGNGYSIMVSSYVGKEDRREAVDIARLNAEIDVIVERQYALRTQIDTFVADMEGRYE